MKKVINLGKKVLSIVKYKRVEKAYESVHKSIFKNKGFVLNPLKEDEKKLYLDYWGGLGVKIKLETVIASKSLSGKFDKRIIPHEVYTGLVEPMLNKKVDTYFLENKNFYNKWFGRDVFPNEYFHKIDNVYYDRNLDLINVDINTFIDSNYFEFPIVVKPSIDSYGGKNIFFIKDKNELKEVLPQFNNLVIQEKLIQHEAISDIYKGSINSVRVCLYRSPQDGKVHFLSATMRFGVNGSLDNLSSGGIACFIKENGCFDDYAVDIEALKVYKHPNTNYVFKDSQVPYYSELVDTSIKIGQKAIKVGIISLDMCLTDKNTWVCIETNLLGQSISFPQHAGRPFFKEFTDEIITQLKK